jgi:hypothetical protein
MLWCWAVCCASPRVCWHTVGNSGGSEPTNWMFGSQGEGGEVRGGVMGVTACNPIMVGLHYMALDWRYFDVPNTVRKLSFSQPWLQRC